MSDEKYCKFCLDKSENYYNFVGDEIHYSCDTCYELLRKSPTIHEQLEIIILRLISRIEILEKQVGEMQNALCTDDKRIRELEGMKDER